jgi:hypothetical protein
MMEFPASDDQRLAGWKIGGRNAPSGASHPVHRRARRGLPHQLEARGRHHRPHSPGVGEIFRRENVTKQSATFGIATGENAFGTAEFSENIIYSSM